MGHKQFYTYDDDDDGGGSGVIRLKTEWNHLRKSHI